MAQFINTSDLVSSDWRFLEPISGPNLDWDFHVGRPASALERSITRPNIVRYRAAINAARAARQARIAGRKPVLVGHLPRMSAATNLARRVISPRTYMISFAFNFTEIPNCGSRFYFKRALADIDEFVVFSEMERRCYPGYFGLPEERFHYLPWAMDTPLAAAKGPELPPGPYLCSIGGEGRDYALLARVMAGLPETRMVVVARPNSIAKLIFPENVTVFENLPPALTWAIVRGSRGMVLPLKTGETACGHISLVGAQLMGTPLAITRSKGVEDYVNEQTAMLAAPGDPASLMAAIRQLSARGETVENLAAEARKQATQRSNPKRWLAYFESVAGRAR